MKQKLSITFFVFAGVGLMLLLFAVNVWCGALNQDEGWYLLTARSTADAGALPYRDYMYTQGPLMALIYSLAHPVVDAFGVLGGRVFTSLLGLLGCVLSAGLAARLAPEKAHFWAFAAGLILVGVNAYQTYFFAIVKTYALANVFLMLGAHAWLSGLRDPRRMGAPLAGIFFAAAAGVRLSLGIVMLPAGLALLWHRRALGDRSWFQFGVMAIVTLAGIYLPFYLMAPDSLRFGLFDYHAAREVGTGARVWFLKAGFVSRFVQAYFVACVLAVGLCFLRRRSSSCLRSAESRGILAGWSMVVLVSLIHLAAGFPYDDYQAVVFPLFAALVAGGLARSLTTSREVVQYDPAAVPETENVAPHLKPLLVLFLACTASAFSSPLNQDWFVLGRDRIWWTLKNESDLQKLRSAGGVLKEWSAGEEHPLLLTQDAYLAVEAGLPVPLGMEMGIFSLYPEWAEDAARERHVMNESMLKTLSVDPGVTLAAFSDFAFSIAAPEITETSGAFQDEIRSQLRSRAIETVAFDAFGHGHTPCTLLRLGAPAEGTAAESVPDPASPE